jgi:hypothetical protein
MGDELGATASRVLEMETGTSSGGSTLGRVRLRVEIMVALEKRTCGEILDADRLIGGGCSERARFQGFEGFEGFEVLTLKP